MQDFGFSFGISLGFKGLSEILKATNNVDKLSKTLRLNDTYTNKLAKSFDNLKLKSEKLNAAKNNLSSLKGELLSSIGKGLALSVPVKISADIEDSMNDINSFLNVGKTELNEYKNSLLDISSSFGAPMKEVTNLAEMGARLGIKSKAGLKEFSELGLKYQKVYKLSNEETSNFLSKLSNIYNLNTTQMNELGSSMLEVSRIANVSASSVAKIMNEVGGDAKMLGLDAKSTSALSAVLASATKDEGEAVNVFKSLSGVLGNLNNASEETKQSFKSLGMDTAQLSAYFKQDAAGAINILLNQIKTLPEDEMKEFLKNVFGDGNAGFMKNLVDNTNKYEDALKSLKNVNLNSLDNEFKRLNSSTNSSFAKLSASLNKLTAVVGDALAPAVVFLCDSFTSVINIISNLITEFPTLSTFVGSFVAIITSASIVLTAYKTSIAVASLVSKQFGFNLKILTTIMNVLKWACLSNPITAIFLAVATIATLVIMNWDKVKAFFSSFLSWLSSAWDSFYGFFTDIWNSLKNIVNIYINAWKNSFNIFSNFFKNIWNGVLSFFSSIWNSIINTISKFGNFFKNTFNEAFSFVNNIINSISSAFSSVFDYCASLLSSFGGFWQNAWSGIGEFFTNMFGGVFDWFSSKFEWLMNAFKKIKSIGKYIGLGGDDKDDDTKKTPPPPPPPVTLNKTNVKQGDKAVMPKPSNISQTLDTTINVSVNGNFNISSNNGTFDLGAFAKEIEKQVVKAIDKRNDKAKQTSLIG